VTRRRSPSRGLPDVKDINKIPRRVSLMPIIFAVVIAVLIDLIIKLR
jgi:hypothetical protein